MTTYKFNAKNQYQISQKHMKKLFDIFHVTDIESLKQMLDSELALSQTLGKAEFIKKRNLLLDQQIRFMKHRNDFIENFGVDISDSGRRMLRTDSPMPFAQPSQQKYSADEWKKIFEIMVTQSEDFSRFTCICKFACERRETMATHLYDNHEKDIRFALQ